jgi:hypothetical protein
VRWCGTAAPASCALVRRRSGRKKDRWIDLYCRSSGARACVRTTSHALMPARDIILQHLVWETQYRTDRLHCMHLSLTCCIKWKWISRESSISFVVGKDDGREREEQSRADLQKPPSIWSEESWRKLGFVALRVRVWRRLRKTWWGGGDIKRKRTGLACCCVPSWVGPNTT